MFFSLSHAVLSSTVAAILRSTVICDWWISNCFVCFLFQGSLLCDHRVSGNNRLVKFASQIFMISLILVTSFDKNSTHHRDLLRYS